MWRRLGQQAAPKNPEKWGRPNKPLGKEDGLIRKKKNERGRSIESEGWTPQKMKTTSKKLTNSGKQKRETKKGSARGLGTYKK